MSDDLIFDGFDLRSPSALEEERSRRDHAESQRDEAYRRLSERTEEWAKAVAERDEAIWMLREATARCYPCAFGMPPCDQCKQVYAFLERFK